MRILNKIILLVILSLYSCGQDKNDDEDRHRYFSVGHHKWESPKHKKKIDQLNYTASEVPLLYYILKETGNIDPTKIDSIIEATKTERIIEFEFHEENNKDLLSEELTKADYSQSFEYMSFKIQNDFFIVTSQNDTINCSGAIVDRKYQVTPQQKILLFFTGVEPKEKIQLVYNDRLFGNGIIKFKIDNNSTKLVL